jgi:hypothetical protein
MWTTYRWLIIIGAASAGLLALSLVAYPLAVTLEWGTGRGLIKVLMSVSGCAMMLAWIAGAACRIITGELGGRIDRAEAKLVGRACAAKASEPAEYDDRYLAGYADGLAGRTLGDGNVVALNGSGRERNPLAT